MTERFVRTTPTQEPGHPSNKALETFGNYVNTQAFIKTLETNENGEDLNRLIKETRDQHLISLEELSTAEIHYFNEIKFIVSKANNDNTNGDNLQELKKSGFTDNQIASIRRLMKTLQEPT